MHEEEEEPEDAYEILEKKRQKEIEVCELWPKFFVLFYSSLSLTSFELQLQEWRAHQIATGEAKDNANFQPLGGDWYLSLALNL